jgi:hypothetical protein
MILIIFIVTDITELRMIFVNETKWEAENTSSWAVSTRVVSMDTNSIMMHEFVSLMRFSISVNEMLRTVHHRRMLGVNWRTAMIDLIFNCRDSVDSFFYALISMHPKYWRMPLVGWWNESNRTHETTSDEVRCTSVNWMTSTCARNRKWVCI